VHGRVEGLTERREGLDAESRERGAQFRAHQAHAVEQRIVGRCRGKCAVEVVDRRQQLLGELGDAALLRERGLARDALSVVLEVGLGALREREVLVALGRERAELVEVDLQVVAVDADGRGGLAGVTGRRAAVPRRGGAGGVGVLLVGVLLVGVLLVGVLLVELGLVERPLEFSFEGLQRSFQLVEEYAVLTCVSNPVGGSLIGNARYATTPKSAIAAINRLVAIGRLMNPSEMFTANLWL